MCVSTVSESPRPFPESRSADSGPVSPVGAFPRPGDERKYAIQFSCTLSGMDVDDEAESGARECWVEPDMGCTVAQGVFGRESCWLRDCLDDRAGVIVAAE